MSLKDKNLKNLMGQPTDDPPAVHMHLNSSRFGKIKIATNVANNRILLTSSNEEGYCRVGLTSDEAKHLSDFLLHMSERIKNGADQIPKDNERK